MKVFFNVALSLYCGFAMVEDRPSKPPGNAICINQVDFSSGSFIIDSPGSYKLCEDITFNPNPPPVGTTPAEGFDPSFSSGVYDENFFGLGFFAAIVIAADYVDLWLDGHTIQQSTGHALMQRFYANIELANSPFIEGAGPAQFVGDSDTFVPATSVRIFGPGVLGRSSHHGIHGNNNVDVQIVGVTFRDFEVAAVALNNVDGLVVEDNVVQGNRKDVPVTGMFSAARFIRQYGAVLKDQGFSMQMRGQLTTAAASYDSLVAAINNVYDDVVNSGSIDPVLHPMEHELFDNAFKVIDGPWYVGSMAAETKTVYRFRLTNPTFCSVRFNYNYAFLVHGKGPAVGGQGFEFSTDDTTTSSNIVIQNNIIEDIKCWNKEIPAAVVNGKVQNDARGAVFQFVDAVTGAGMAMNADGTYKGNVVADMQIMVAKAIQDGFLLNSDELQTGVNTIDPEVVSWAESIDDTFTPLYLCNGDSMHHVVKGVIVIRIEDTEGFEIVGNMITNVENLSVTPFVDCAGYHGGASPENLLEQQAGNVRVISVAATRKYAQGNKYSRISKNVIDSVDSVNGDLVVGIDIQGKTSGIRLTGNQVDLKAGVDDTDLTDKYIALRVRSEVEGSSIAILGGNVFAQEIQNNAGSRLLRSWPGNAPHPEFIGLEWANGGCPYANKPNLDV